MTTSTKRPRISLDVMPELRRRLRLAAAKRDLTIGQYVLGAIEERLRNDLGDEGEAVSGMAAKTDPVLAELWDNPRDAEYDRVEAWRRGPRRVRVLRRIRNEAPARSWVRGGAASLVDLAGLDERSAEMV